MAKTFRGNFYNCFQQLRKVPGGHFHIDGVGDVPLDRVWFSSHHHWHRIDRLIQDLNRPNWLLAGYSVYHRVASQDFPAGFPAHNVYVRPAISAPATVRAGRNRFLWMYDDTQQNRESVRTSTNEPWLNARSRNSLPLSQGMHMKVFSKVYCDRVYFFVRRVVWDRVRFSPPVTVLWRCPPPGGGGGKLIIIKKKKIIRHFPRITFSH